MPIFYTTGNVICAECGRFMVPELRRDKNDVITGELVLRGHLRTCSKFGKTVLVKLPRLQGELVAEDREAMHEYAGSDQDRRPRIPGG